MAWNPGLSKEEHVLSVSPSPARDGKNGSSKRGSSSSEMAEEDLCDEGVQQLEKKRRLTSEQVKFLEDSFEMENKLEPERKLLIAKKLGLQPRQIAVWFQNRRARWKTKQLECDFEALKASYDAVLKENEELQNQVALLNDLLNKKKLCVQGQVFGTVVKQEESIPLLSAVNASSKSLEQSVDKVEELSEVDSPSDQSEVLDSGCYNPPSDLSQFFEESAAGYSDDLLEYYCRFNFLPPAVKLEESMFQEENCNFAFTLEETVLFPCYS